MTTPPPDLIVVNADIVTMDPLIPRAEALAVSNGRITRLGSSAEIAALKGAGTEVVDAGGRLVLPGFQDTHLHLQDSGLEYAFNIKLDRVDGIELAAADGARFRRGPSRRAWIIGGGWNFGMFSEQTLTRAGTRCRRAGSAGLLVRFELSQRHHQYESLRDWPASTRTADPLNGVFVRDAAGKPTGMLYEDAMESSAQRLPVNSAMKFAKGVRWGQRHCNKHGITGVLDARVTIGICGSIACSRSGRTHRPHLRDRAVDPEETRRCGAWRVSGPAPRLSLPMLRVHSAKFFLDGIVENRTAAMLDDYSDASGGNAPADVRRKSPARTLHRRSTRRASRSTCMSSATRRRAPGSMRWRRRAMSTASGRACTSSRMCSSSILRTFRAFANSASSPICSRCGRATTAR